MNVNEQPFICTQIRTESYNMNNRDSSPFSSSDVMKAGESQLLGPVRCDVITGKDLKLV